MAVASIRPVSRWLLPSFLALSVLGHLAFWALVLTDLRAPTIDLEFQLPVDVEFGLTESVEAVPIAPPGPAAEAEAAEAEAQAEAEAAAEAQAEAEAEAARKRREAARERREARKRREEARARREAEARAKAENAVGSQLPPGAQIAVRIDMARIRESPIAEDVRGLLAAIPDWDALLDGSGIEPLDQLDRLLIATPNLQRSRLVVAGRYQGDRALVDTAVAKLAASRDVEAEWEVRDGVPVAPWANKDVTPRVIALIGPQHFSISREEDLPRLLAIAAERQRQARERRRRQGTAPEVDPAEELLSMPDAAGLSLEVEGVRNFIRRGHGIPTKLRIHALETEDTKVKLVGRWVYDDEAQAAEAERYWNGVRQRMASNTLVAILGLAGPLRDGKIEQEGVELHLEAELSVRQTRLILGYLRELVAPPPPMPPPSPTPTPSPTPSPTPGANP